MIIRILLQKFNQLSTFVRYKIFWAKKLKLGKDVFIKAPWASSISSPTIIGDGTRINGPIRIVGKGRVLIGKYGALGADIKIISSNHVMNRANLQIYLDDVCEFNTISFQSGEVIVGNNVWIGDSVIVLSGVHIGDGSIVGSGAVVTRDIPPFSIAVGVPAKVIRKRFSDNLIFQLLEIKWWDWQFEKIKRNRDFFAFDLTQDPDIILSKLIKP